MFTAAGPALCRGRPAAGSERCRAFWSGRRHRRMREGRAFGCGMRGASVGVCLRRRGLRFAGADLLRGLSGAGRSGAAGGIDACARGARLGAECAGRVSGCLRRRSMRFAGADLLQGLSGAGRAAQPPASACQQRSQQFNSALRCINMQFVQRYRTARIISRMQAYRSPADSAKPKAPPRDASKHRTQRRAKSRNRPTDGRCASQIAQAPARSRPTAARRISPNRAAAGRRVSQTAHTPPAHQCRAPRTGFIWQVNVEPTPGSLLSATWPPLLSTMCLTIDRPSPVPPLLRERDGSTR